MKTSDKIKKYKEKALSSLDSLQYERTIYNRLKNINKSKFNQAVLDSRKRLIEARQKRIETAKMLHDEFSSKYGEVLNDQALNFLINHSNIAAPTLTSVLAGYELAKKSRADNEFRNMKNELELLKNEQAIAEQESRTELEKLKNEYALNESAYDDELKKAEERYKLASGYDKKELAQSLSGKKRPIADLFAGLNKDNSKDTDEALKDIPQYYDDAVGQKSAEKEKEVQPVVSDSKQTQQNDAVPEVQPSPEPSLGSDALGSALDVTVPETQDTRSQQPEVTQEAQKNNNIYLDNDEFEDVGKQTPYDDIFSKAAKETGLPENYIKAVAKAESSFDTNAKSGAGAEGIMQLMPATARELGVSDRTDPEQSIMAGAKYLKKMYDKFNDYALAYAGYHTGATGLSRILEKEGTPFDINKRPELTVGATNVIKNMYDFNGEDINDTILANALNVQEDQIKKIKEKYRL